MSELDKDAMEQLGFQDFTVRKKRRRQRVVLKTESGFRALNGIELEGGLLPLTYAWLGRVTRYLIFLLGSVFYFILGQIYWA